MIAASNQEGHSLENQDLVALPCLFPRRELSGFLCRFLGVSWDSGSEFNWQMCLKGGLFLGRCISRPAFLFGFGPRNV